MKATVQRARFVGELCHWNFKLFPFLSGTLLKTSVASAAIEAADEKK